MVSRKISGTVELAVLQMHTYICVSAVISTLKINKGVAGGVESETDCMRVLL